MGLPWRDSGMRGITFCLGFVALVATAQPALSADPIVGERAPVLRLEPGGPTAQITGMAFSPDGKTLYVAGLDKVVRVWKRDARNERFEPTGAYRVPLGPGFQGALNALAVSPDGKWLATAGSGAMRLTAGFREPGLVWVPSPDALSPDQQMDQGTIYVFDTQTQAVHRLLGHHGTVWSLAFVQGKRAPLLASTAWAWNAGQKGFRYELRLWDVATGKTVAEAPVGMLPASPFAYGMGLAAWSTGPDSKQVRVALADNKGQFVKPDKQIQDGKLLIWDAAGGTVNSKSDGPYNAGALFVPESKSVLTSSSGKKTLHARFQFWDTAEGAPTPGKAWTHDKDYPVYVPLALAPVLSQAGEIKFVAAVCLAGGKQGGERKYCLSLFNPADGSLLHEQKLWQATEAGGTPVVAVGPHGGHIAVAGNKERIIQVFALDDLIDRKPQPRQQDLRSVGKMIRQVCWVASKNQVGLLLRPIDRVVDDQNGPGTVWGDQVFVFAEKPDLTNAAKAWSAISSASLPATAEDRWKKHYKIQNVTATAFLPAGVLVKNKGLLAIAYMIGGEAGLGLYDADTLEQVRELTGHVAAIRSLSFSKDGTRLASAAEDQTVAVWDLAGIPQLLGGRGTLRGVSVVDQPGKKGLRVAHVEPESSAAKNEKLRGEEVIVGLVEKAKVREFDTARDFYVALSEHKPGSDVTLRLADGKDIKLTLDQAIDERKPLLSLFITRDSDWIGWSPTGPYESSGMKAEGYLGWHIGTDKPDRPTTFALAKEYHKEYHQPGALSELYATGKVQPKPPPPPPKPRMSLFLGVPDGAPPELDPQGRLVLKRRSAVLRLQIEEFPTNLVKSVSWQLDGGARKEFAAPQDHEWTVNLGGELTPTREPHIVRVILETKDDDPRRYTEQISFRYQPPPPGLELLGPGAPGRKTVNDIVELNAVKKAFPLKVKLTPGPAGEKVKVSLTQDGKELKTSTEDKVATLERNLELHEGLNLIKLLAANEGAQAGDDSEVARLVLRINFRPEPVRIVLRELVPMGDSTGIRLDAQSGDPIIVHTPRVRLKGIVQAKGKAEAEWQQGKAPPVQLTLGKDNSFDIPIQLKPGNHDFTFQAATADAKSKPAELKVRFAPLPPAVTLIEPDIFYAGAQKELVVRGTARWPEGSEGERFTTAVLVNGKEMKSATAAVNEKDKTAEIRMHLKPGFDYNVELRLKNTWEQESLSNSVLVQYRDPPTNIKFPPPPEQVRKPLIDLQASVESRLPLTRAEATVQVGDTPPLALQLEAPKQEKALNTWTVHLKNVPLGKGANVVRLWAANEQGLSREYGETTLVYTPVAPPPIVTLVSPAEEQVKGRSYQFKFQVQSKAPLKLVEVIQGKQPYPSKKDLRALKPNKHELYELEDSISVRLEPGTNRLEVIAVNEGGSGRAAAMVSCVVVPVRVELDKVVARDSQQPVMLRRLPEGAFVVPQAPQPLLDVTGRVVWDDPKDPQLIDAGQSVRVYANGFQQRPAELQPAKDGERQFRAEVLLNRAENNEIEFELPTLIRNAENRLVVKVDKCAPFEPNQYLHLLIIGAGETDENRLVDSVLRALGARQIGADEWRTNVFEHVVLYGPLISAKKDLTPAAVRWQLRRIEQQIRARQAKGSGDIILIYFKGGESLGSKDRGHVLRMEHRPGEQQEANVACADLLSFFTSNRGAHLLFLDVVRDNAQAGDRDELTQWRDNALAARVGVFRWGWRAGQQQAKAAEAARLDQALQDLMPQATRLRDVESGLRNKSDQLAQQIQAIRHLPYFYVYPALESVVINAQSDK
jgi:WD40 repeat protein